MDFLFRRLRIWKCNASRDNEDPSRAHEVLFNSVLATDFRKRWSWKKSQQQQKVYIHCLSQSDNCLKFYRWIEAACIRSTMYEELLWNLLHLNLYSVLFHTLFRIFLVFHLVSLGVALSRSFFVIILAFSVSFSLSSLVRLSFVFFFFFFYWWLLFHVLLCLALCFFSCLVYLYYFV